MGAPELPGDPGEDLSTRHIHHTAPMPSDDSDNESTLDQYGGYEPLAMDDPMETDATVGGVDDVTAALEEAIAADTGMVTHGDPNLPPVESADVEIERQIWSEPRPQELQIELDTTRTAQILSAMANFSLPNVAVPDWAAGVPEERWKEELLQRIRQRKEQQTTAGAPAKIKEKQD